MTENPKPPAAAGKPQISYKEYLAKKEKDVDKAKKSQLPLPVKIILAIPVLAIFCFGLFFIPFMLFKIFMGMIAPS